MLRLRCDQVVNVMVHSLRESGEMRIGEGSPGNDGVPNPVSAHEVVKVLAWIDRCVHALQEIARRYYATIRHADIRSCGC